ncbi:4-hydroxythreonine-4-phosphate dehydrogenase PdxA [Endozoicomonadaceae bacterium StTr2]
MTGFKSNVPLAISMGDAAGIGPEIIIKTFSDPAFVDQNLPVIVIGDTGQLRRANALLRVGLSVNQIDTPEDAVSDSRIVNVISPSKPLPQDLPYGKIDARAGKAAYDFICTGIDLAMEGKIKALVTAPIHKESLSRAGVKYPGHTEILADRSGTRDYAMMLFNDELRVILVTIHQSLRNMLDSLTVEKELKTIRLAHTAARQLGIEKPRVAVAGVNPHAGEGGLFGDEDDLIVKPAIAAAQQEGIDASGPWPGDTVFMQARNGDFDIVVAQYHDQGLIPVKYLGVDGGVNVTVGLPFIRTSVDHGTAFPIAGTGEADHSSLLYAIRQAQVLQLAE